MDTWKRKQNMTFKEIARQNKDHGFDFFKHKEQAGYKKEISPDWTCMFVMSDAFDEFHVFQFNPFTSEIVERKSDCPNKESAKQWLDKNRWKYVWVKI